MSRKTAEGCSLVDKSMMELKSLNLSQSYVFSVPARPLFHAILIDPLLLLRRLAFQLTGLSGAACTFFV